MCWCVHGVKQPKALPVPDHRLLSAAKLGVMARTGSHMHPHARMCPQWGTGAMAVGQVRGDGVQTSPGPQSSELGFAAEP